MGATQRWSGLVLLAWPCLSGSVFADGKVFATAVATSVTTPDQRALLHFADGVQRLVIETSFVAGGTNFAWVIPLPSAPQIEAVATNFFPQLSAPFQPELVYLPSLAWMGMLLLGGIGVMGIRSWRRGRFVAWLVWSAVIVMLATVLAIPNFVKARGGGSEFGGGAVQLLNRKIVGVYDTVVLGSSDGAALLQWLNTNGYDVPASALPVISSYAARGWVFAGVKLQRESSEIVANRPHPLALTFRCDKPLYPLRLTGVGNGRCQVELYVFGPARSEAKRFEVEYCVQPTWPEPAWIEDPEDHAEYFFIRPIEHLPLMSAELRRYASPAAVVTKMVGNLSARDMQEDAEIRWVPYRFDRPVVYSRQAALHASINWGVGVLLLGALGIQSAAGRLSRRARERALILTVALALVCGATRFLTARVTDIERVRNRWAPLQEWRRLSGALEMYHLKWQDGNRSIPANFDEIMTALGAYLKGGLVKNTFTGSRVIEAATPGNLTLEKLPQGIGILWHDIHGVPHRVLALTNAAAATPQR